MVFTTLFSLFGCGKNQTADGSTPECFEYRESGYTRGFSFTIDNGKLIFENYDEGTKAKRKLDTALTNELMQVLDKYDIYSWNGFDEVDEEVLDGMGFTLFIKLSDGTIISANGNNRFPKEYFEFKKSMIELVNGK